MNRRISGRRKPDRSTSAPLALAFLALLLTAFAGPADAAAVTLLPPPGVSAAEVTPRLPYPGSTTDPEILRLAGGERFVLWGLEEVFARRVDADGQALAPAFTLVAASDPLRISQMVAAPTPEGGFLVALLRNYPNQAKLELIHFDAEGRELDRVDLTPATLPEFFMDMAVDAEGRPAVAWSAGGEVRARFFDAGLAPIGDAFVVDSLSRPDNLLGEVRIARLADGRTLVLAEELVFHTFGSGSYDVYAPVDLRARLLGPAGQVLGDVFPAIRPHDPASTREPAVAPGHFDLDSIDGDAFLVAWVRGTGGEPGDEVMVQRMDRDAAPTEAWFPVSSQPQREAVDPTVVPGEGGRFAVLWTSYPTEMPAGVADPMYYHGVRGRFVLPSGQPAGDELEIPAEKHLHAPHAAAATYSGEDLTLAWLYTAPPRGVTFLPPPFGPDTSEFGTVVRAFGLASCVPAATRLCLQDRRFAVEVDAPDRSGTRAPARAVPLTDDTGTFWFFRPENVELMVKVLDGTALNGHFWFFSGALSDVDYTLRVTDLWTGHQEELDSGRRLVSFADTAAFANPEERVYVGPVDGGAGEGSVAAVGETRVPPSVREPTSPPYLPIADDPTILCLHEQRFQVTVVWEDPRSGKWGSGFEENLTDESGYFWFFRDSNVELVVKILDGTPVNGHWWVFIGGLTDVAFTLTVEDTLLDNTWTFENPPYALRSTAHTTALPGAPAEPE